MASFKLINSWDDYCYFKGCAHYNFASLFFKSKGDHL